VATARNVQNDARCWVFSLGEETARPGRRAGKASAVTTQRHQIPRTLQHFQKLLPVGANWLLFSASLL